MEITLTAAEQQAAHNALAKYADNLDGDQKFKTWLTLRDVDDLEGPGTLAADDDQLGLMQEAVNEYIREIGDDDESNTLTFAKSLSGKILEMRRQELQNGDRPENDEMWEAGSGGTNA